MFRKLIVCLLLITFALFGFGGEPQSALACSGFVARDLKSYTDSSDVIVKAAVKHVDHLALNGVVETELILKGTIDNRFITIRQISPADLERNSKFWVMCGRPGHILSVGTTYYFFLKRSIDNVYSVTVVSPFGNSIYQVGNYTPGGEQLPNQPHVFFVAIMPETEFVKQVADLVGTPAISSDSIVTKPGRSPTPLYWFSLLHPANIAFGLLVLLVIRLIRLPASKLRHEL